MSVPLHTDPSHDVLEFERRPLDVFFRPRTVAVIGATETAGSVGRTLVENIRAGSFDGVIYPINPRRSSVLGIPAYPAISSAPGPVDLAVIATPAPTVPEIVRQCGDAGVRGAIIISAGFKEVGTEGQALERQVLARAREARIRVIGPNCLGVMAPTSGLNATFAQGMARPGTVAFLSQSGALCTAILDWSLSEGVGFSAFISVGSMLDVSWGDLIDHLGSDPNTHSIVLYMESVGDARSFLSAAREVALSKPIVLIKAGRTSTGARAAASHTGALTGSDDVLEAALRRCGVVRVERISDVFFMAEALSKQPRPKGPRLTILTNAGGPGVLATDALIDAGGELSELEPATIEALSGALPAHWSHANPVDVLGDAGPERYASALEIAGRDPGSDGLLVILTPQAMTDPTKTAEALAPSAHLPGKPVIASWMGAATVEPGREILGRAGIPDFPYPDTAARIFQIMWRYSYHLRGLYETPHQRPADTRDARDRIGSMLEGIRAEGRSLLTEDESKSVLAAYNIPTVPTTVARTEDEAVEQAGVAGYPAVLKLYSHTITHKTDVGGVRLNLEGEVAIRGAFRGIRQSVTQKAGAEHFQGVTVQPMVKLEGYELILGCNPDPQFGPVLLFGSGGQLVEVYRDRALGLPPLNTTLARRLMEQTRIFTALEGVRGRSSVNMEALTDVVVAFSRLVVEQPWIKEFDINPLLAGPDGLLALDARVVLYGPDIDETELPRPAIRPYPNEYTWTESLANGKSITIRPIGPEDEPLLVNFHQQLSDRSVLNRYAANLDLAERITHERLARICFVDYDRQIALVAEGVDGSRNRVIMGVGRITRNRWDSGATFALLVADPYQQQGIGSRLLIRLVDVVRSEGVDVLKADIEPGNAAMQSVAGRLGFTLTEDQSRRMVTASLSPSGSKAKNER